GRIEDFEEFRFDALLKIRACPLGRTDRADLQRLPVQFIVTKETVAAGIPGDLLLRFAKDDERLLAISRRCDRVTKEFTHQPLNPRQIARRQRLSPAQPSPRKGQGKDENRDRQPRSLHVSPITRPERRERRSSNPASC